MKKNSLKMVGLSAVALLLISCTPTTAGDKIYGKFPVTVKGYSGAKSNSVAYTGQIARQVLLFLFGTE